MFLFAFLVLYYAFLPLFLIKSLHSFNKLFLFTNVDIGYVSHLSFYSEVSLVVFFIVLRYFISNFLSVLCVISCVLSGSW